LGEVKNSWGEKKITAGELGKRSSGAAERTPGYFLQNIKERKNKVMGEISCL